jgi:opacity protein-like surface antigen
MPTNHPSALFRLVSPERLKLAIFCALCCSFAAITVQAQEGYYIAIRGGVGKANDITTRTVAGATVDLNSQDQHFVAGAFGKDLHSAPLRIEGEFAYFKRDFIARNITAFRGETTALAAFFNAYYLPVRERRVTPYIGGGLGVADIRDKPAFGVSTTLVPDSGDAVFAYQFKAGLEFTLQKHVAVGAGYRFFGAAERNVRALGQTFSVESEKLNLVEFALRFNF